MNDRTRLGLGILAVAAIMGMVGDALLRETPWGLNVLVWIVVMVGAVSTLSRLVDIDLPGSSRWLALALIGLAALFAWRDSPTLKVLDGVGLAGALSLAAFRAKSGRLLLAGITEYAEGLFITAGNAIFGPFILLLQDIKWGEIPGRSRPRHLAAAGRGLLIALPLLVVFGGLFMAADAAFQNIIQNVFDFNLERIVVHGIVATTCAWSAGGSLRAVFLQTGQALAHAQAGAGTDTVVWPKEKRSQPLSLGIVEVGLALGLLDLLFFCFVVVQFRYFFGGAATVEATTGLTYAEYARHGFFELVTVALLVLPLLLMAHWLLRKTNLTHERIFRVLAGTQIVLLFVIMLSALQRMRLYQGEYGLTELRLYTTAFMGWLAIVFVWFAATVLRGKRERFAFGALVAGAVLIGALHLVNPDALIVRTNAERAKKGRGFDAQYATTLSADAVPALVAAFPALSTQERSAVASRLLTRWMPLEHSDWRSASWSRREAWQAIQENGSTLWNSAVWQGNERSASSR